MGSTREAWVEAEKALPQASWAPLGRSVVFLAVVVALSSQSSLFPCNLYRAAGCFPHS